MKHLLLILIALFMVITPTALAQETTEAEAEATEAVDMDDMTTNESEDMDSDMMSSGDFTVNTPEVDPMQTITFVRFGNFAPDIGTVDYYLAGNDTPIIENMEFGDYSDVVVLNSGNLTFISRPAGSGPDGEQLSSLEWNFSGGTTWFFSGIGLQSETAYFLEPVSIVRYDYNDQARVRVMNLVTDKQNLSVTSDNIEFANNIEWVGLNDTMLDEGDYDLTATLEDGTTIDGPTLNVEPNHTYTLIFIGMNDDEYPAEVVVLKDKQDTTRVKFVSNRSTPVEIFAMPAGEELVDEIASGEETEWIDVPSGALTFTLFEPNTGPDAQEITAISRQLSPGRDLTVTIDDSGLAITDEAVTP